MTSDDLTSIVSQSLTFIQTPLGFQWEWTDWLGLVAIILAVTFCYLAVTAVRMGTPPLEVLREIGRTIRAIIRKGSN